MPVTDGISFPPAGKDGGNDTVLLQAVTQVCQPLGHGTRVRHLHPRIIVFRQPVINRPALLPAPVIDQQVAGYPVQPGLECSLRVVALASLDRAPVPGSRNR